MILHIKCLESSFPTLSFLCIKFFIRVFENVINKVFQKSAGRAFKMANEAFFRAHFVRFLSAMLILGGRYPDYTEGLRKKVTST